MLSSGMWRRVDNYVNRRFGGTYRLHLRGRKPRERGNRVNSPPGCRSEFIKRRVRYQKLVNEIKYRSYQDIQYNLH
jgi:hypothetical protein